MPSPLNGYSHSTLVFGAGARLAAGFYFAPIRNILTQFGCILIIYRIDFIAAKGTNFAFGNVFGSLPFLLGSSHLGVVHALKLPISIQYTTIYSIR